MLGFLLEPDFACGGGSCFVAPHISCKPLSQGASMLELMLHPQTVPQAFCHPVCVHTKLDRLPRILNFASAYADVKSEDF